MGPPGAQASHGERDWKSTAKAKWELPKHLAWEKTHLAALVWGSDVKLRLGLRERQKLQFERGWKGPTRRKWGLPEDLGLQKPSTRMTSSNI